MSLVLFAFLINAISPSILADSAPQDTQWARQNESIYRKLLTEQPNPRRFRSGTTYSLAWETYVKRVIDNLPPPPRNDHHFDQSWARYSQWIGTLTNHLSPDTAWAMHNERRKPISLPKRQQFSTMEEYFAASKAYQSSIEIRDSKLPAAPFLKRGPDKPKLRPCWKLAIGLAGMVGTPILFMGNVHHDISSLFGPSNHIGFGIYYDHNKMLAVLSPEERELLISPVENQDQIENLIIKKLSRDYDYTRVEKGGSNGKGTGENLFWFSSDYPWGIDASRFLDPNNPEGGVCRHKARIAAAFLNRVGIPAEVQAVATKGSETINHSVVYLPRTQMILDPTNDLKLSLIEYTAKEVESWDSPQLNRLVGK